MPFLDAYLGGDYEQALDHAKRIRMPVFSWCHLSGAAAAGQLGRAAEARASLAGLRASHPHLLDVDAARQEWSAWFWQGEPVARLVEGLEKALALTAGGRPASGSDTAAGPATQRPPSSQAATRPPSGVTFSATPAGDTGMRVAVLPFSARGGDDAHALADGLTDDITTALARFPYLQVVSRVADRNVSGDGRDERAGLGARFVLEGAVRASSGQLRVSTHLSDTHTGAHLWAETFDRSLDAGLFSVQDDIVGRVAATVADGGGVLVRALASHVKRLAIATLNTEELVLRYHGDFAEHFDVGDHAALRDAFAAAVAGEPGAAPAWACLAALYAVEIFFDINPKPDPLARLRHAAERANRLDPDNQQGWVGMATAALFDRDRVALQTATDRIAELNPFHSRSLATVGQYMVFSGDTLRGMALVDRSIALNQRYPGWYLLAPFLAAYEGGDFDAALRTAKRIGMPNFVAGHLAAAAAAGQVGVVADATPALDALARFDARLVEPDGAREVWSRWIWDPATIDRLVEGLEKARALTRAAVAPADPAAC